MKEEEFKNLIGKDIVVDYNFNGEKQVWSLKNFSIKEGKIKHNRLPIIISTFIKNCTNPHIGEPTHG